MPKEGLTGTSSIGMTPAIVHWTGASQAFLWYDDNNKDPKACFCVTQLLVICLCVFSEQGDVPEIQADKYDKSNKVTQTYVGQM